ncbi:thermonuclease family protein [Sphingobacterium psychroaquaticum]|uniref:Endonuclease YncB, thermonuclease family n=1 Tax=Sphingobacterium psychroaquaticum TaxID=561061 RepID=A0A1X7KPR9_9SPHI|nr:thermonuclease family protein [Sphingobacterium psychroaquaticum]QBQ40544.1 hypothetical protein E2P86_05010 [Sphingobacterium psychroaquaticum]SMG43383.1 Endonuclease YncB, thermonuclease family [Sphingobacterium psychroaquaticum]
MKITFVFIYLFASLISHAQTVRGKVVRVADGDTITILDSNNTQIRIRFHGIDCPENGQDFGQVARRFTSDLCFGKKVKIDVKSKDQYGRTVGIVWVQDTLNVNLELLRAGLAWHYKLFDKSTIFAEAEQTARMEKVGLWKQKNAVAPWLFRKRR